jgi:hypothetical protein
MDDWRQFPDAPRKPSIYSQFERWKKVAGYRLIERTACWPTTIYNGR